MEKPLEFRSTSATGPAAPAAAPWAGIFGDREMGWALGFPGIPGFFGNTGRGQGSGLGFPGIPAFFGNTERGR